MKSLLGVLLVLSAVSTTGCAPQSLTAPPVCVEWGPRTNANGDVVTVCKKYDSGSGSWLW